MNKPANAATSLLRKLTDRSTAILDAVLNSSVADQALAEVEQKDLARRDKLIASLDEIDREHKSVMAKHEAEARNAYRQLESAETAFQKARDHTKVVGMHAYGAEIGYLGRRKSIVGELITGADSRLEDFIFQAENIFTFNLPFTLKGWYDKPIGKTHGEGIWMNNSADLQKVEAAIKEVVAQARALQLQSVRYVDVSQALMGWCERLAPVLALVDLNPPSLSAEHAEPGPAITWAGVSEWVVSDAAAHAALAKETSRALAADNAKKAKA